MRRKERIPIFLKLLDWHEFIQKYELSHGEQNFYRTHILEIAITWQDNPDWRFGQLLFNLNLAPNSSLFYIEDNDILKEQGIEPKRYLLWGTHGLDKDDKVKEWKKSRKRFGLSKKDITISPTTLLFAKDKQSKRLLYTLYAWLDTQPKATYKVIKDLNTDHIKNILKTQTQIPDEYKKVFKDELKFRKKRK